MCIGHNEQTVGTCGNCGGPVVVPIAWWGINPPGPQCKRCGAFAKRDFGPPMPMEPPHRITWSSDGTATDPTRCFAK